MNLDQHFFQVSKLSETKNKRSSPEMKPFFSPNSGEDQKQKNVFTRNGTLFSPNSGNDHKKKGLYQKWNIFLSTDLCSDTRQSQILAGDADEDHTQIVGEKTVKLLGGDISLNVSTPLPVRVFIHLQQHNYNFFKQ